MADSREDLNVHPGEVIPLQGGTRAALEKYASDLRHTTHGTVLSYKSFALVMSIQDKVVIKRGYDSIQREVNIMRFVAERFSVPLPKIYGVHTDPNGWTFLVMECIKGQTLGPAWPELGETEKEQVAADLKRYIDELRLVSGTYIGSLNREPFPLGGGILDYEDSGPFENEKQFNEALLRPFDAIYKYHTPVIREMLNQTLDHRIVFTHADLQMKNIMVHEGRISAILDWELAGFYPEYWDYASAWLTLDWYGTKSRDWPVYVQKSLKPYPVEAATISIIYWWIWRGY